MRQRVAALVTTTLALAAATLAWATPALADTQGFDTAIQQAPATFTIGTGARTLTAVVSTDQGSRCHSVRWALTISTTGISLDQVKVDRIENGQSFPFRTRVGADAAQLVDDRLDPGQVCRGRTDTGQWQVAFAGPDDGQVTFQATALDGDGDGTVFSSASVSSRVVTAVADKQAQTQTTTQTETDSPTASPSPTFSAQPTEAAEAVTPDATSSADQVAVASKSTSGLSVLVPGLIVGLILVLFGVALLLRLRSRNRRMPMGPGGGLDQTSTMPTGFYNYPSQ